MNHTFTKINKSYFLLVSLIVVSFLSACSGAQGQVKGDSDQAGSAGLLSVSSSPDVNVPKQESSAGAQLKQAALKKNTRSAEQNAVQPGGEQPAAQASAQDAVEPVTAARAAASAPLVKPAVDLSIPEGPKVGMRAPDFTLQTTDGKSIQLSSLLGQPVVINYWATWCVPCKAELPILEKLHREYQSRGLVLISVDAIEQDTIDKVQVLSGELGITFPILLDTGNQFASNYQALFFPTTYFIDASGVIRHITLGDSTEAKFREALEKILNGGS